MGNEITTTPKGDIVGYAATLAAAVERGVDPATLAKMMDLQDRWEAGQARKAFVAAMSAFKAECPSVIGKDKRADFGAGKAKYSYATTGAIVTAITPALSKNGLSLSWETSQATGYVTVTCHVTHSGGHRESATLTGPKDESGGKNPIQMIGSSVHYLQRYTMVSVLGLATADMDDPDTSRPQAQMTKGRSPLEQGPQTDAGGDTVTGILADVKEIHSPDGAPKAWVKWGLTVGDVTYGTFDAAIGAQAHDLRGCNVALTWKENGKHKNVVGLVAAGAGACDPGNEV